MRHRMAKKFMSELDVKKTTGISRAAVNRIRNGLVCPSLYQAVIIANALDCSVNDLVTESFEDNLIKENDYTAVIFIKDLLNSEQKVLGFIENHNKWKVNAVGFKVDQTFNCKILNTDNVVVCSIENELIDDGDTVLFCFNKKHMIGTIQNKFIKSLDNLSMIIDVNEVNIIGKVISIEAKYIKDKETVNTMLKNMTTNPLNFIKHIKI